MSKCTYEYQDGFTCHRDAMPGRALCILHEKRSINNNTAKRKAFHNEILLGETNFEGICLPIIKIENQSINKLLFNNVDIGALSFKQCTFKESFIICNNSRIRHCKFQNVDLSDVGEFELKNSKIDFLTLYKTSFPDYMNVEHMNVGYLNICCRKVNQIDIENCRFTKAQFTNVFVDAPLDIRSTHCNIFELQNGILGDNISIIASSFSTKVNFTDVIFRKCLDFKKNIFSKDPTGDAIDFNSCPCQFEKCQFQGRLSFEQCKFDDCLSFKDSTFADLKSQEDVCRRAKTILDGSGYHELADIHHLMEMQARRKQKNCFYRSLEWFFMDFIAQYGTSFKRLLWSWGFLLFGATGFYWLFDGIKNGSSAYKTWRHLFECLYFSVVTATTLGYGDLQPVGGGRLIAASEAMLGMLLWTLLLVVIARKYMRS